MSAGGVALALVVGGGGIALLLRARAKQETPSKSACKAIAEKTGIPAGACEAGLGLIGAIGELFKGRDWAADDKKNKDLNGAVKTPLAKVLAGMSTNGGAVGASGAFLRGTVVEFENGCRPFKGAAGWEKCAAGTADMGSGEPVVFAWGEYLPGKSARRVARANIGTGNDKDPLTQGPLIPNQSKVWGGTVMKASDFPMPIPSGQKGWFYKGRPMVCDAPDNKVRDHRDGEGLGTTGDEMPYCGKLGDIGPPPPVANQDPDTWTSSSAGDVPAPGMTWEGPRVGGFWRRLKAGETPRNRPPA